MPAEPIPSTTEDLVTIDPITIVPQPVTEKAATRKFSTIGWEGIFKISTRLLREKEIDIDDRLANVLFTLEMETIEPWEFKFENLHVVLKLNPNPPQQNISINGQTKGNLILFDRKDGHELFPGAALNKELMIKTGAFSSKNFTTDSAIAGLKNYSVEIEYDVIPITRESQNTVHSQLVFFVASD